MTNLNSSLTVIKLAVDIASALYGIVNTYRDRKGKITALESRIVEIEKEKAKENEQIK